MLQAETRLNFEVEMQHKTATTQTNYVGTGSKDGALGGYKVKRAVKCCIKQHLEKTIYGISVILDDGAPSECNFTTEQQRDSATP